MLHLLELHCHIIVIILKIFTKPHLIYLYIRSKKSTIEAIDIRDTGAKTGTSIVSSSSDRPWISQFKEYSKKVLVPKKIWINLSTELL